MKLGMCILRIGGDKTSRKRNFEFRPLRRAGEMTPTQTVVLIVDVLSRSDQRHNIPDDVID